MNWKADTYIFNLKIKISMTHLAMQIIPFIDYLVSLGTNNTGWNTSNRIKSNDSEFVIVNIVMSRIKRSTSFNAVVTSLWTYLRWPGIADWQGNPIYHNFNWQNAFANSYSKSMYILLGRRFSLKVNQLATRWIPK